MLTPRTEHFVTSESSRCVNTKSRSRVFLSAVSPKLITAFAAAKHRWHTDCVRRLSIKVAPPTKKQTVPKQLEPINAYGNPRGLFEHCFVQRASSKTAAVVLPVASFVVLRRRALLAPRPAVRLG